MIQTSEQHEAAIQQYEHRVEQGFMLFEDVTVPVHRTRRWQRIAENFDDHNPTWLGEAVERRARLSYFFLTYITSPIKDRYERLARAVIASSQPVKNWVGADKVKVRKQWIK